MNKSTRLLLAIAAVVIIAGGVIFAVNMNKQPSTSTNTAPSTSEQTDSSTNTDESTASAAATITYNGSNFTLSTDTINAGDTVTVVNTSDKELDFDSDPHPVHTDNPELNAGSIAAGESKSFTITTKGTWGFHNHLNASQKGSLTVK